jgi:hypothetical protein
MSCHKTIVSMAPLFVQIFFSFLAFNAAQYLFYCLNEIPGLNNRNCSGNNIKNPSVQKAKVMRILLFTINMWHDIEHSTF